MRTVALVDFSFALRVNYHARAFDSTPNECGQHTLNQLSDWRRKYDHVIVCLDSPPYWRSKEYPEYKGTRDRDDQAYPQICKWTKERLVADGYSIASSPGFEADDIMASLAPRIQALHQSAVIHLITGDKDATQCIFTNVVVMAPKLGGDLEARSEQWVYDKWGITPSQVPLLLAICGDKSDNIPGIKGIGEKGAAKLIKQFKAIGAMRVAAVEALDASKAEGAKPLPAFWRNFLEGSKDLEKWMKLTTLRTDVPLDVPALMTKQEVKPLVEDDVHYDPEDDGRPSNWRETFEAEGETVPPKASAPPTPDGGRTADPKAMPAVAHVSTAASDPCSSAGAVKSEKESESGSVIVSRPAAPSWALQLQPTSVAETVRLCALLFNSRFLGQFGSERGVTAIVLMGRELGLGAMASLEMFHIVKDKPFPKAKGLRFLAERDPNCEWIQITHADDKSATIETKHRKAGMLKYTYTIERARKAGYLTGPNKHNWNTLTQEMLEARTTSKAVNRWYSGSTFGMTSAEEMQDRESEGFDKDE